MPEVCYYSSPCHTSSCSAIPHTPLTSPTYTCSVLLMPSGKMLESLNRFSHIIMICYVSFWSGIPLFHGHNPRVYQEFIVQMQGAELLVWSPERCARHQQGLGIIWPPLLSSCPLHILCPPAAPTSPCKSPHLVHQSQPVFPTPVIFVRYSDFRSFHFWDCVKERHY